MGGGLYRLQRGEWGGGGAVPVGLYGMLFFPHRYTSKSTYCDNVITPIHMSFIKGGGANKTNAVFNKRRGGGG